jgi:NADH-quinone oxidoreductase subunit C
MTLALSGLDVERRLRSAFPETVIEADERSATVKGEQIVEVGLFLRDDPEVDAKFLNSLFGVDWLSHFEVVYVLSSLARNHMFVLKARIGHEFPELPSVASIWMSAHLQEREVYDLMGISFGGHPNLKRIFLWEGFPGHPLRKDFLALPGGFKPGLQRFPFEFPAGQRSYPSLRDTLEPSAPAVPRLDQAPSPPGPAVPSGGQLGPGIEEVNRTPLPEDVDRTQRGRATPQGAGSDPAQAAGAAEDPGAREGGTQ